MYKPEGIMPALVTPFTDDAKSVDEERLRTLVNRCLDLGVHGVVPCGTTGEFVNLKDEEKKRVIKIVVDAFLVGGNAMRVTRPDVQDVIPAHAMLDDL